MRKNVKNIIPFSANYFTPNHAANKQWTFRARFTRRATQTRRRKRFRGPSKCAIYVYIYFHSTSPPKPTNRSHHRRHAPRRLQRRARGRRAHVPRVDRRARGQRVRERVQRRAHLRRGAAREVGAADGVAEERVAGEADARVGVVQAARARRVAGRVQRAQDAGAYAELGVRREKLVGGVF